MRMGNLFPGRLRPAICIHEKAFLRRGAATAAARAFSARLLSLVGSRASGFTNLEQSRSANNESANFRPDHTTHTHTRARARARAHSSTKTLWALTRAMRQQKGKKDWKEEFFLVSASLLLSRERCQRSHPTVILTHASPILYSNYEPRLLFFSFSFPSSNKNIPDHLKRCLRCLFLLSPAPLFRFVLVCFFHAATSTLPDALTRKYSQILANYFRSRVCLTSTPMAQGIRLILTDQIVWSCRYVRVVKWRQSPRVNRIAGRVEFGVKEVERGKLFQERSPKEHRG